jgi:hypothetical protein
MTLPVPSFVARATAARRQKRDESLERGRRLGFMGLMNDLGTKAAEVLNRAVRNRCFAQAEAIGLDMTGENAAAMDRGDLRVWLDSPHEALFADQSEAAKAARRQWMQPRVSVFDQPPEPFVLSAAAQAAVSPGGAGLPGAVVDFESIIIAGRRWLDNAGFPEVTGVLAHFGTGPETATTDPRWLHGMASGEIEPRDDSHWFISKALVLRGRE